MTAQEMIDQAMVEAATDFPESDNLFRRLTRERFLLRQVIRHLCDPENVPYPMTSPEL
jgi:hypothetical protein